MKTALMHISSGALRKRVQAGGAAPVIQEPQRRRCGRCPQCQAGGWEDLTQAQHPESSRKCFVWFLW